MKITQLQIIDFGKFHREEPHDTDNGVVLFLGNNEAGKTTIFNLIKTLLYGFSPATCDKHPYSSWDNNRIEFTGRLMMKDEGEIQVYRRLLSQPKAQLHIRENVIDIKNNPLPYVSHISSDIYEKIYALRVEDLMELEGRAWDEVQDKLLANYGSQLIKNSKEVIKKLNEEANQIYKDHRRGSCILRQLEEEISKLETDGREAKGRQDTLRSYRVRLDEIQKTIGQKQDEKVRLKEYMRRVKELLPLKHLTQEIEGSERAMIHKETFKLLPTNTLIKWDELLERQLQIKPQLEGKLRLVALKKAELHKFSEEEIRILNSKANINLHLLNSGRINSIREILKNKKEERTRINDRINYEGKKVFGGGITKDLLLKLDGLNLSEVRIRQGEYKQSLKECENTKGTIDSFKQNSIKVSTPKSFLYAAIVGIPLTVGGFFLDINFVKIIGIIIMIAGIGGYISFEMIKRQLEGKNPQVQQLQVLKEKLAELEIKHAEKTDQLLQLFHGIPTPEIVITNMDEVFMGSLFGIKDDYYKLMELENEISQREEELQQETIALDSFYQEFSIPEGREEEKIYYLKEHLEELEKKKIVNEGLSKEIFQLEEEAGSIENTLNEINLNLDKLNEGLKVIGDGDLDRGIEGFQINQRLQNKLRILEEKLLTIDNLAFLRGELQKLKYTQEEAIEEINISMAEASIEELEDGISTLKEEQRELQLLSQQLLKETTLDEIESQLLLKEAEYQEAVIKRDRLVLMAEIIKAADEEFKEENQPDVLKNAAAYFKLITLGKYTNIYIEETDKDPAIMVREKESPAAIKVTSGFSKGTLNQLYLSLRLSLMDHLDKEGFQLPICFDEAFINWDEDRLDSNLELLQRISEKRQIFFFTCHNWLAERIEKKLDIKKIILA